MKHYSVMKQEAIDNLNLKEDGIYVDATLGYAGHSKCILKNIKKGYLFAFDADQEAIIYSEKELKEIGDNFKIFHRNFSHMKECLEQENISKVDGILFDLGVSSPQIDEKERGFSFMQDGPLDMRMDRSQNFNAKTIVNEYEKEDLLSMFYSYGEEPRSKTIVDAILNSRKTKEITTTKELVSIIEQAVGAKYFYEKHPERQIFQAIRIEVNNELNVLESVLPDAISLLNKGGRICVITFHSLEDRIVKRIFKNYSEVNEMVKGLPEIPKEFLPSIQIINKKPIQASLEEIKENPRSKSAKLRVIEKVI